MKNRSTIALLLLGTVFLVATPGDARSEVTVTFEYQDVGNFFRAHESLSESLDAEAQIQSQYIDIGTPALTDYIDRYKLSARNWIDAIAEAPSYFASLTDVEENLRKQELRITSAYEQLLSIFPTAMPMHVNYVIGPMVAGGIQAASGVIIAAEIYGLSDSTDTTEIPTKRRLFPTDEIAPIVLHEFAHTLQMNLQGRESYLAIYGEKSSLLAIAIREGTADFIAELAAGATINSVAHEYGDEHQAELWTLFREDMYGEETGDWLFYTPKEHSDWPTDLGYFMGYKIVESYYQRAPDKRKALLEILEVTDYADLVARSGYNPH